MNISVIIPAYNAAETFERCINSVLKNLTDEDELIIIDDGSVDNTYIKIQEKYNQENVKIYHQENSGSGSARNLGINIAKKEYIWFIDIDDFIVEDSFSKIKQHLNSKDVDILFFGHNILKSKDKKENKKMSFPENQTDLYLMDHFPWNKVIKSTLMKKIKFPDRKMRFQDQATIPIAIKHAKSFGILNHSLYNYDFTHTDNISKKKNKMGDLFFACEELEGYLNSKEYNKILVKAILYTMLFHETSEDIKELKKELNEIDVFLTSKIRKWRIHLFKDIFFNSYLQRIVSNYSYKRIFILLYLVNKNLFLLLFTYTKKVKRTLSNEGNNE